MCVQGNSEVNSPKNKVIENETKENYKMKTFGMDSSFLCFYLNLK